MEFIGGIAGGDWNSDLLPQFLTNSWVSYELNGPESLPMSSSLWPAPPLPSIDEAVFCSSETCYHDYQDGADQSFLPISESFILENKDLKSRYSVKGALHDPKKRHGIEDNVSNSPCEAVHFVFWTMQVPKKENGGSKKRPRLACSERNNNENPIGGKNGGSTSDCSSEDPSASPEWAPKSLASFGKARAARGSATDPQSVYARKRINGKLRTLQNLAPNGAKVDISTMLEEAAHYVKFVQLQIKALIFFFFEWASKLRTNHSIC